MSNHPFVVAIGEKAKAVQTEMCGHIELEANRVLCLQAVNGR